LILASQAIVLPLQIRFSDSAMTPLIEALVVQLQDATADGPIEVVETHISWVLLTREFAYKIKKAIQLPFADFRTLEQRRVCCEDELRLNRRLAPALYIAVVPIGGTPEQPVFGAEPAIEFAVKMRRFPNAARLDRALQQGRVTGEHIRAFADVLARFHRSLPPAGARDVFGAPKSIEAAARDNVRDLHAYLDEAHHGVLSELEEWIERQLAELRSSFAERKAFGAVREGHGDLHLENLALLDDAIVAFDCLEFAAELRWADVLSEIAFLTMDLIAHQRDDLAFEFLNGYFEFSGDYAGLVVFPFYSVHRALVRAKVAAIRAAQSQVDAAGVVERYLDAASSIAERGTPCVVITHGLSGSGKTTLSTGLIARLPGIRLRSDVERKRLAGLSAQADSASPVAAGLYARDMGVQTYAHLLEYARHALEAGINVIVDAAFLRREQRVPFMTLAQQHDAPFVILDCHASEDLLRARIESRRVARSDASEATESVLDYQLKTQEPLNEAELATAVFVDCAGPIDFDAVLHAIEGAARA
jgi:aminoglycoside phosphotransferase family enzyme/predicted kinase